MNYDYEEQPAISTLGIKEPYVCHTQISVTSDICAPLHSHEYIEMLYCTAGVFDIWLNGKYFNFSTGDLVVINSHEMHLIKSQTAGSYIVLRFIPDIIYDAGSSAIEAKYITPFLINNSTHQRIFRADEIAEAGIAEKMQNILHEYTDKPYAFELAIKTYICSIFLWILRYWSSKNIVLSIKTNISNDLIVRIRRVMDYIENHFRDDFTVSDAAKMCNVSYSYFSRIFKEITKHSFSEYLNYVRITEAEKLLATTDMSMTEIAMQTGFSTSSYFIQQFKLHKNISPKQFRKNLIADT